MSNYPTLRAWIIISVLILGKSIQAAAQCNPPASVWLVPPQTSTALVLKWSTVPGANQYQLRYWETATPTDKTIVDNCGPFPFTLRGLKKSTAYTMEIRAKCGTSYSAWSTTLNGATISSSGSCANIPTGVLLTTTTSTIKVSWTSTGSHTVRYRLGSTGDWLIPTGAIALTTSSYTIAGLVAGTYQVEVKRNCSATAGAYQRFTTTILEACGTPLPPIITPGINSALVALPNVSGVIGYNVEYREGTAGPWINGGNNIPPSIYVLNPPLLPFTSYQIRIQAVCVIGTSGFSNPISFNSIGPCLANKDAGKNMSTQDVLYINQLYNNPSPHTFGSMFGLNDGGLNFRSFINESYHQISPLTNLLRIFHTMDEDFNATMQNYALNLKPKQTIPEGTPAFTAKNKGYYTKYKQLGFSNIVGATELLQYDPQSWKDKIYKEGDWSVAGPSGISGAYQNYVQKIIDEFAPANGSQNQMLMSSFQVGNELWDYPFATDYQSLLSGARNAFINRYGPKANGGWRMKLVVGAFQAFRDNNCNSFLRDFSNCGGALERFDFIGDVLNFSSCDVLKDLDAVDCHPYSFKPGTNTWTYPEDPTSETAQIRNMAFWLESNRNLEEGILKNTRLWSTEFGYDSHPVTGVGEKTQSAYLIRGMLLHSRYHYERIYLYNAFDVARPTDQYYDGLYNSSGLWKLGTHPANSAWASPLEAHGATAKPAWYGLMDFKGRFSGHVFYKALVEDADAYVIMIAKPDGTDPYLVFWSPKQTNDANLNQEMMTNKTVNWTGVLAGNYKVETPLAQTFAESNVPGQVFPAVTGTDCGITTLTDIRRNPAFIRLVPCSGCPNITNPGTIVTPSPQSGTNPFNPGVIASGSNASGGSGGSIVYQWQQSIDNINFADISGATASSYDPPSLSQTTYFRRAAKRSTCSEFGYTASIVILVGNACPNIATFKRIQHNSASCNSAGDYYYEVTIQQVSVNDQITIAGLPSNGVNIGMSMLNGNAFTPASFQTNLQFVDNMTLKWQVNASNGSTQVLRLYYCWANAYPNPVSVSSATSMCSGQVLNCALGFNEPEIEEREKELESKSALQFTLAPNPGSDQLILTYHGAHIDQANIRMVSLSGQSVLIQTVSELEASQEIKIETSTLAPGIYFVCIQTGTGIKWVKWERI